MLTLLETVLNITEAGAVVAAVWIGAKTLNAWRREMIGRKKADLAEQTLAAFYEARDIIRAARHPGSFEHEGRRRTPIEGETEDEAQYRNWVYVPAERLLKENEFFARLEASKYRFMALFGKEHATPFDRIQKSPKSNPDLIRNADPHLQRARRVREEERRNREMWERDSALG